MVSYYCYSSCCFSLNSGCRSHHKRSKAKTRYLTPTMLQRKFFRDKQWWSFLKRSDGHGGLCSSSKIKDTLRAVHTRNQDSMISVGSIRKPNCSSTVKSPENIDFSLKESYAIGMQATIRSYLAQNSLSKLKNVVKLQAIIRGHLVRRQAMESLRCVQAIAKLQTIIRARRAQMSVALIGSEEQYAGMYRSSDQSEEIMGSKIAVKESKLNNFYRMKFQNNSFAKQLLELTPKRIPIYMKCDISKPDSAWKWLERWSSSRSSDLLNLQNPKYNSQNKQQAERADQTTSKVGSLGDYMPSSTDRTPSISKHDSGDWDFEFCQPMISFSVSNDEQEPRLVSLGSSNAQEKSPKVETNRPDQLQHSYNGTSQYSIPGLNNRSVFAYGNAQTNFEALSSTATSCSPICYLQENAEQQLRLSSILSSAESLMRSMEPSPRENIIFSDPIIELGGSDSGTELSISSTLDSPDRPEVGIVYFGKEASMANLINRSGSMDDTFYLENLDIDYVESGSLQVVHRRSVDSIVAIKCSPVAQIHKDAKSDKDPHRLSTDEYFKRHITESESHTMPSRKTPSKGNRSRLHRSESAQNSKWQTVRKQSPPQPNHIYSSGRKSTEKLRKDQNNWNRRISFGSEKADNADQEQRGRSSTQSVPSYMQATESARAKAHTNSSARPSTDGGQANADYVKKPNLLSGTNVKQSSPCKQRSVPYSEEGTTVHHGGSYREKWQR